MDDYELSEQLFLDIWDEYGCPKEMTDICTICIFLNKVVQKSEHMIVLDHYSHINFDRIERVEYEKSSGILKLYYFDYTHYQKKQLAGTITEDELDEWYLHGFHTYEYLAINVNKLKFVRIKNHLFVLLRANTVQAREMQKKIVKKNQLELKYKNINDMYIS